MNAGKNKLGSARVKLQFRLTIQDMIGDPSTVVGCLPLGWFATILFGQWMVGGLSLVGG